MIAARASSSSGPRCTATSTAPRAAAIEERITGGHDVLLEIDWQGALQIKRLFPNAVLIFILPPSWDELQLAPASGAARTTPEVIAQRMANARIEVSKADQFDFVIINALFETALFDLKAIVHSQRLKYAALRRTRPADLRRPRSALSRTPARAHCSHYR